MGFLIPENIPSRNDVPELLQDVARCLRDMVDDSVTVWLHETDGAPQALLVLDPSAGLVLLEAPSQTTLGLRKRAGIPEAFIDVSEARRRFEPAWRDVPSWSRRLLRAEERLGAELSDGTAVLALPTLGAHEFAAPESGGPTDRLSLERGLQRRQTAEGDHPSPRRSADLPRTGL